MGFQVCDDQNVRTQLAEKANQEDVNNALAEKRDNAVSIKMVDLDTEVKTAMTGGSVAVVGVDSTGKENIKDKAVTPNKTSFIRGVPVNLFDKTKVTEGIVNKDTGGIIANTNYYITDFIPCVPGKTYPNTGHGDSAFYNSSKVYVSGLAGAGTLTAPANCYYLKTTIAKAILDTFMISETTLPGTYRAYDDVDVFEIIDSKFKNLIDNSINVAPQKINNYVAVPQVADGNMIDKSTVTYSKYVKDDGTVADASVNTYCTDYIPVHPKMNYMFPGILASPGCWYDSNKNFISKLTPQSSVPISLVSPENAAYVRWNGSESGGYPVAQMMIVAGATYPAEYIAYVKPPDKYKFNWLSVEKSNLPYEKPSKWTGKKWNCMGDSITEHNFQTNKNYHDYIAELIDCSINNYGISTVGYGVGGSNAFYQRVSAMDITADLITVFGGTNDWGVGSQPLGAFGDTDGAVSIYGAIDSTLSQIANRFVNKTIAIFTPLPRDNSWGVNAQGITLEQITQAIIKVANKYSLPVLDLYHESNFRPWNLTWRTTYQPDGLHPNDAGHQRLAEKILTFINSI
jgi:lysophospholipase L1-like esterase